MPDQAKMQNRRSNVEKAAKEIVVRILKRDFGEDCRDVGRKGVGYDLESEKRKVEVKGSSKDHPFIMPEESEFRAAAIHPDFELWLVEDALGDHPRVYRIPRKVFLREAKAQIRYVMPLGKKRLKPYEYLPAVGRP